MSIALKAIVSCASRTAITQSGSFNERVCPYSDTSGYSMYSLCNLWEPFFSSFSFCSRCCSSSPSSSGPYAAPFLFLTLRDTSHDNCINVARCLRMFQAGDPCHFRYELRFFDIYVHTKSRKSSGKRPPASVRASSKGPNDCVALWPARTPYWRSIIFRRYSARFVTATVRAMCTGWVVSRALLLNSIGRFSSDEIVNQAIRSSNV